MVNAHTHIYSGLAPFGLPAPSPHPKNFVEILERVWWRLDRALDATTLRASARYYVAHALLSGTTCLIDHHESPSFIDGSLDILADACQELGIRAVLTYGATERNGGRAEAQKGLAECRRFVTENRRPLVEGMVGLHASFTVSDDTIKEAGELCRALDLPLHIHMAEDHSDVEDARKRGWEGPLERLLQLNALPRGSILAHGIYLLPAEVCRAREAGAWIVQNPRSNRGNRVGFARNLGTQHHTALGTDGYPSDLWDEADALRVEARLNGQEPEVAEIRLSGSNRLAEALCGGAVADDAVEFDESGAATVTIAGRRVVQDGILATGDLGEIEARAREAAPRLWARMAWPKS